MKTKIKRIVILLIMGLLVCMCNVGFAETWAEFLNNTTWQMQNPQPENWSVLWSFEKKHSYETSILDMNTNTTRSSSGDYVINGNQLTIACNGYTYVYSLRYINEDKFEAQFNGGAFQMSRSKSKEDTWLESYLMFHNPSGGGGYDNGDSRKNTYEICYTCKGLGRCVVCGGSGINYNSYTGDRSICSACSGTGKCWHCFGSGKQ